MWLGGHAGAAARDKARFALSSGGMMVRISAAALFARYFLRRCESECAGILFVGANLLAFNRQLASIITQTRRLDATETTASAGAEKVRHVSAEDLHPVKWRD
jgi:hypothetical protein